jgi:hypothetical protein
MICRLGEQNTGAGMLDAEFADTVDFLAKMVSAESAEDLWSLLTAKMAS